MFGRQKRKVVVFDCESDHPKVHTATIAKFQAVTIGRPIVTGFSSMARFRDATIDHWRVWVWLLFEFFRDPQCSHWPQQTPCYSFAWVGKSTYGMPMWMPFWSIVIDEIERKGIVGRTSPLPWNFKVQGQTVVACRHIHPWELAILTGSDAERPWGPQIKLSLCGLDSRRPRFIQVGSCLIWSTTFMKSMIPQNLFHLLKFCGKLLQEHLPAVIASCLA